MTKLLRSNDEMIIHAAAARELTTHTLLHLPQEVCGVLLGTAAAGDIRIEEFHPIRNVAPNPLHAFMFHPEQWVKHCLKHDNLIGIVHSHPHTLPIPSEEDLIQLHVYGQLIDAYLICSPDETGTSISIQAYRVLHPTKFHLEAPSERYILRETKLTST